MTNAERLKDVTLDEAEENFLAFPSERTARDLILVAMDYWQDGMIGNATMGATLASVSAFLPSLEAVEA